VRLTTIAGHFAITRKPHFVVEGNMSNGFNGPTLQGKGFELVSSDPSKANHILTITQQAAVAADDSIAFIAGTWQGDGPNVKNFVGSITASPVRITCSWINGMNGLNALVGHVVSASRLPGGPEARLRLDATVVVTDDQGNVLQGHGPGQVSGLQILVAF
jgi:hypothetical protein